MHCNTRVFIAETFTWKKSYEFFFAHLEIGWFNQTNSNTQKMGTESVPETFANLHILTWLSVRENFIEFSICSTLSAVVSRTSPFLLLSEM
jgi:hypothetical protein